MSSTRGIAASVLGGASYFRGSRSDFLAHQLERARVAAAAMARGLTLAISRNAPLDQLRDAADRAAFAAGELRVAIHAAQPVAAPRKRTPRLAAARKAARAAVAAVALFAWAPFPPGRAPATLLAMATSDAATEPEPAVRSRLPRRRPTVTVLAVAASKAPRSYGRWQRLESSDDPTIYDGCG